MLEQHRSQSFRDSLLQMWQNLCERYVLAKRTCYEVLIPPGSSNLILRTCGVNSKIPIRLWTLGVDSTLKSVQNSSTFLFYCLGCRCRLFALLGCIYPTPLYFQLPLCPQFLPTLAVPRDLLPSSSDPPPPTTFEFDQPTFQQAY